MRKLLKYLILKTIQVIEKVEYLSYDLDETDISKKVINSIAINEYEVLTDTGYSPISFLHNTQPYDIYHLRTENGKYLQCADNHIVFNEQFDEIFVSELTTASYIMTDEGLSRVSSVTKSNIKLSMSDLTVEDLNHRFYANGILGHNSVTSALFILWFLLFHAEKTALIVADNFTTTRELMDKFRICLDGLPFFMKPGIKHINSGNIKFDNDSRIVGRTTTKKSGIGLTVNLLYIDEFAHINESNLDEFYRAILPTITADPSAKVIISSTPNGKNKFYDIWADAVEGKTDYVPLRVDWWQVKGRDEEWKRKVIANMGSVEDFNQEYGLQFFSSDQLLLNSQELKRLFNIKTEFVNSSFPLDEEHYYINDYLSLHPNYAKKTLYDIKNDPASFVVSIDTADGVGADYSVLNIYKVVPLPIGELLKKKEAIRSELDTVSLVQIGHFRSNEIDITIFAAACDYIIYNILNPENVRIVLEMNHKGELIKNRLQDNPEYWNTQLVHTKHTEMAAITKPGIRLGPTNKIRYCEQFKYLVAINKIIPVDVLTIMELMSFGKTKGGQYRGQNGNDDLAMTCVNLAPFFDSPQFWDLATQAYERMPIEYQREVEEKIFSLFRGGANKPLFNYDELHRMNIPQGTGTEELQANQNIFNLDSLGKMKNLQGKFFNS